MKNGNNQGDLDAIQEDPLNETQNGDESFDIKDDEEEENKNQDGAVGASLDFTSNPMILSLSEGGRGRTQHQKHSELDEETKDRLLAKLPS